MIILNKRNILALLSALVTLTCSALDPLTGPVGQMDRHLRVGARSFRPEIITMSWNGNRRVEVTVPPAGADDIIDGVHGQYKIYSGDSLIKSGTYNCTYPVGDASISVILRVGRTFSEIEIGSDSQAVTVAVPFDRINPVGTDINVPPNMAIIRNDMRVTYLPAPEYSRFRTMDALNAYLAGSSDPNEGIWRFLDRSTDRTKAQLGGRYSLALVRNDEGGYDIIYLSGATEGDWQPLRIRGHLTPNGFVNNFELEWLDSYGVKTPAESYATVDTQEGIMTLVFPLLNSRIRLARMLRL